MTAKGGLKAVALLGVIGVLVLLGAWLRGLRGENPLPGLSSLPGTERGREERQRDPHGALLGGPEEDNPLAAVHAGSVTSVAFSPNGRLLASASADGTIILWGLRTKRAIRLLTGHTGRVTAVAFSPDGTALASSADDMTVRLWGPQSGQELRTCAGHTKGVRAVAFSPDGAILASGAADGTVRLWEVPTGRPVRTLSVLSHESPATGYSEVPTGRSVGTLADHPRSVGSVAFSLNGKTVDAGLAVGDGVYPRFGDEQAAVWRWEFSTGRSLRRFRDTAGGGRVANFRPLASFPDGQRLAWGVGTAVKIGNVQEDRVTATLDTHFEDVTALALAPDGRLLASGAFDKTIILWDLATQQEVRTLYGHFLQVTALGFSPDGQLLASAAADRTVRLWDPQTGTPLATLGAPLARAEEMWEVKVLASRREESVSHLLQRWTPQKGYVFLMVELSLRNKLEEPNLLYIPSFQLTDGKETYRSVGGGAFGIAEEGRYFRFYKEAGSTSAETLIFVVPTAARGLKLRFLDLPPIDVG